MKAYLRSLVVAYKAAIKAGQHGGASYIQGLWSNAAFEFSHQCSIDDEQWLKAEAPKVDFDWN